MKTGRDSIFGSRRGDVTVKTPTFSVEVITLPVSDFERALRFYIDQVGFTLDVDYSPILFNKIATPNWHLA
jgi:predicted enzyme related to lactoylglutathione lyase